MSPRGPDFRSSVCSSRLPVNLYWHELEEADQESHRRALEDHLFEALDGRGRLWNPFSEAHLRGQIRARLNEAAAGLLEPPDRVKGLRPPNESLYEIRWQGLNVVNRVGDEVEYGKTNLRLLFAEPKGLPHSAVGLVAFEKPLSRDGKAIQDEAIATAVRRFHEMDRGDWQHLKRHSY